MIFWGTAWGRCAEAGERRTLYTRGQKGFLRGTVVLIVEAKGRQPRSHDDGAH